jgi:hypothetical protein
VTGVRQRRNKPAKLKLGQEIYSLDAPGLKSVRRPLKLVPDLYWVAEEAAIKSDYQTKTVRIHPAPNASHEEIIELVVSVCRAQHSAMLSWLDGEDEDKERLAPKFNGTLASLADRYESDADSAYQELKSNSAEGYPHLSECVPQFRPTIRARVHGAADRRKDVAKARSRNGRRRAQREEERHHGAATAPVEAPARPARRSHRRFLRAEGKLEAVVVAAHDGTRAWGPAQLPGLHTEFRRIERRRHELYAIADRHFSS